MHNRYGDTKGEQLTGLSISCYDYNIESKLLGTVDAVVNQQPNDTIVP